MFGLNGIYEILRKNRIRYKEFRHKILNTKEEEDKVKENLEGIFTKTILVKSNLNEYYIIFYNKDKNLDLTKLAHRLGLNSFILASKEELYTILKTTDKRLSILNIINDIYRKVTILIDKDLKNEKLLVHPDMYTRTIAIHFNDVIKIIDSCYKMYIIMEM